jgi:YVTN family beta-propeller protein
MRVSNLRPTRRRQLRGGSYTGRWFNLGLVVVWLLSACGSSTVSAPPTYTAYVLNFGDGTMTPFALASGIPGTPIRVGPAFKVWSLAITPDSRTAYVAEEGVVKVFNLPHGILSPVTIPVPGGETVLAMAPDGKTAYLGNTNDDTITAIDLATNKLGAPLAVGTTVLGIAIAADSKTAYDSNFDATASVIPINLANKSLGTPIRVAGGAALAMAPDGKTLYVAVGATVVPMSLPSGALGTPITIGFRAAAMVVSPDGKSLHLVNFVKAEVVTLDLASGQLGVAGTQTPVGNSPVSIAIARDSGK